MRHVPASLSLAASRMLIMASLCIPVAVWAGSSVELHQGNYQKATSGKTVFIKLFSPGCSHCQKLAPAWERMAAEWVGHAQGLVGQVDCTVHASFCDELGATGLPALLFGEPSLDGVFLHEYGDDKAYRDLSKFANETLHIPMCTPGNLDPCDDEKRNRYSDFLSWTVQQMDDAIAKKEEEIHAAETKFRDGFKEMQKTYDELAADQQLTEARIKSDIRMITSVLKSKKV